jgi:hypothetical protein
VSERALSEDGKPLLPVGTRLGRGRPDFCRTCGTVTRHVWIVVSHEWWHCHMCGDEHFTEGCEWACTCCGEAGDGLNRMLTDLARAGCEPERVDG